MKTKLKIIIPIVIAVIAIIIAAFAINFTSGKTVDISSLIVTAQNYLHENKYEQAIAEFSKVIELDPMNVVAYIGLSQAYHGMGDIDQAIEILETGYERTGDQRLKDMLDLFKYNIPENAYIYKDHSYFVFSDICSTWEEAREYCNSLGGYLAVINDEEENKALYNIMKLCGFESAYFGYSDAENEGEWTWVNGEKSDYTNWNVGEPGNGYDGENYAMFYFKWEYTWNDGDFNVHTDSGGNAFICEWDIYYGGQVYTSENVQPTEEFVTICEEQYPKSLTELKLNYVSLTDDDIHQIAQLEELENLHIGSSSIIGDISELSDLPKLTSLSLNGSISDLSVLNNFTQIKSLDLSGNQITDISPLSSLIGLEVLDLSYVPMADVSPLGKLINLKELNLYTAYDKGSDEVILSGLNALGGLTGLKSLNLNWRNIDDISFLQDLTNLEYLNLSHNFLITDAEPLSDLKKLTYLDLSYTHINDTTSLSDLTDLVYLNLYSTEVTDITSLFGLENLEELHLTSHKIKQEDKNAIQGALPNCIVDYG